MTEGFKLIHYGEDLTQSMEYFGNEFIVITSQDTNQSGEVLIKIPRKLIEDFIRIIND